MAGKSIFKLSFPELEQIVESGQFPDNINFEGMDSHPKAKSLYNLRTNPSRFANLLVQDFLADTELKVKARDKVQKKKERDELRAKQKELKTQEEDLTRREKALRKEKEKDQKRLEEQRLKEEKENKPPREKIPSTVEHSYKGVIPKDQREKSLKIKEKMAEAALLKAKNQTGMLKIIEETHSRVKNIEKSLTLVIQVLHRMVKEESNSTKEGGDTNGGEAP